MQGVARVNLTLENKTRMNMTFEPSKWTDYRTHLIGHGPYGSVTLTGADARRKRKEISKSAQTSATLSAGMTEKAK